MYGRRRRIEASRTGFFSSRRDCCVTASSASHVPDQASRMRVKMRWPSAVSSTSVAYRSAMAMSDFASTISRLSSVVRKNGQAREHLAEQRLIRERLQGVADAVPPRQHDSRLRPAEDPRNGAEILDAIGQGARRRTRSDVQLRDLGERRHLVEHRVEPLGLVDEIAIRAAGLVRKRIHRGGEARRFRGRRGRLLERRQQRRRRHRLQVQGRAFARPVLGRDDLSLLGDADAAVHGPGRLGANRGERRSAAAADGAAAAVKDLQSRCARR